MEAFTCWFLREEEERVSEEVEEEVEVESGRGLGNRAASKTKKSSTNMSFLHPNSHFSVRSVEDRLYAREGEGIANPRKREKARFGHR